MDSFAWWTHYYTIVNEVNEYFYKGIFLHYSNFIAYILTINTIFLNHNIQKYKFLKILILNHLNLFGTRTKYIFSIFIAIS